MSIAGNEADGQVPEQQRRAGNLDSCRLVNKRGRGPEASDLADSEAGDPPAGTPEIVQPSDWDQGEDDSCDYRREKSGPSACRVADDEE